VNQQFSQPVCIPATRQSLGNPDSRSHGQKEYSLPVFSGTARSLVSNHYGRP